MRRTKHINAIIDTDVITPVNHDVDERPRPSLAIVVSSKLGGAREIEHSSFIIRFGKFGMGQKTPHLLAWSLCLLSLLCVAARAADDADMVDLVGFPPGEPIAPCAVTKRRVGTNSNGELLVETLDTDKNLTSESLLAANQWSYPYKPKAWFWANPFLVYLRARDEDANVKQLCFRNVWGKVSKCAGYALRCKNPVRVGSILRWDKPTEEHLLTLVVELDIWNSRPLHAHLFQGTKALLSMATSCERCTDLLPAVAITDPAAEHARTRYLLMQAVDESGHHRKTIWMDNRNNELISSENFGIVEPPEIYKIRLTGLPNKPVSELWNAERPQLHKLFSHGLRPLGTRYALRGPIWGRYCNLTSERNLIEACRHDRCVDKNSINNLLSYNLSWENAVYPIMDPTKTTEPPKESPKNVEIHWTTEDDSRRTTVDDRRTTMDDRRTTEDDRRSVHWTTFGSETDRSFDHPDSLGVPKSTAEITPEPQTPGYSLTILILIMTSALFLTACVVAFFSLRLHRRSCFWRKRRPYLSHLRSAKLNDPQEQPHRSYAAVSTVTTRM